MHDPYEWYPLLKPNTQIDSIAAYDDKFICGTKQGDLIMYSVVYKDAIKKPEVQLLRYNKNFYRKPIQQLAVIPFYNILVILADNTVFIHDLSSMNFPLISTLQKTKGAHLFTVDVWNQAENSLTHNASYMVRLCVAVKRKLQLFYWKNNSFLELGNDIIVPDIPKSIALFKQSICIGFKGEYSLIELNAIEESGKPKDLFPTGRNLEPNVIQIADSFAVTRDNYSVFVGANGQVLNKTAVKWSEIPIAVAYDEPYLVALLNETIEVRSMQPSLLVQQIQIPGAQLICHGGTGVLYVLAGRQVFRVQSIPADKQIKMLLEEKQFQLAVKLCNISESPENDKIKQRKEIQTLYAYDLFRNKQYQESMKQFLELDIDPYDVIRLYPNLLPQYSVDDEIPSAALQNRDSDKSLQALIDYLTEARLKLLSDKEKSNTAEQEQAVKIIDTTLLKCYLNTNDAFIAPLLRLNNCHIEDTEKILKKHRKYSELIILYQTKGLHQKALELLEKQTEQQDSPLRGVGRTIQYLQNLGPEYIDLILRYSGWVLTKYPEEGLKIFTEDLPEVEHLPRQKVLEYLLRTKKSFVIPYLEHVIYAWNDKTAKIHNALVHQYRDRVLQLCKSSSSATEQLAGQNTRTKLINFLEKSEHYTAETVLSQFPFDSLLEERAVLLGKLKQHNQALAIYVMVLGDIDKAIKYCDQVYQRGESDAQQVFISLLHLLISPQENWLVGVTPPTQPQPDIEMALSLLESNATKISPELALPLLPNDVPIHRIKHYLTVSFSDHLNEKRNSQILRGLLYAEYLQVQELRIRFESENMLITERDICPVCKKRFGNQSAFIRNPNGDVIHFSCQKQSHGKNGDSTR